MTLAYLASPYSGTDAQRSERFREARAFVASMFKDGVHVVSVIVLWHEAAIRFDLPTDANAYADFNRKLFNACDELLVLQLPGWDKSVGVAIEIAWAKEAKKPIRYISLEANLYVIRDFTPLESTSESSS